MNKEQAMKYGVREDAYREFQDQVTRDVNKRVREVLDKRKGGETAFALRQIREAINSMLTLIDDENTLQRVLTSVNRTYSDYLYRRRKASEPAQPTESTQNNPETTSAPETATEGGTECP